MTAAIPIAQARPPAWTNAATGGPSPTYVRYVIGLLMVVNLFNYADRVALSLLLPAIKLDLNLSDSQLGLLVGFAFSLFYAACGIPIARLADRGTRRTIIAVALAVWSAMTALSGAAQNFWYLFAARIGVGAGEAGCLPPSQSLLCDYVPAERRAGVFALLNIGLFSGMMVGLICAGLLEAVVGWRWTFVLFGIPGLALAAIVALTLFEPVRGRYDTATSNQRPSLRETLYALARTRTFRRLVIFNVATGFAQAGIQQWLPSFYNRAFALNLSQIGLYLGLALGIGSIIGLAAGGFAANHTARTDIARPFRFGAAATALAVPAMLGALFAPDAWASLLLFSLTCCLWNVPIGAAVAAVHGVTAPRMRATAAAVMIFLVSVFGFGLGPFCVGWLSDVFAQGRGPGDALRLALVAAVLAIPVMTIALFAVARSYPTDAAKPAGPN